MPDNQDSADLSQRLRLDRPAPGPVGNSLRSRGVSFTPVAVTQPTAEGTMSASPPAESARAAKEEHEVPGIVLLIGLYEFVRAVTLAVIYGMVLSDPLTHMFSEGFWTAFYVLSNGAMAVTPFLPLTIIYAFAVGTCLWMRANWGRRALIATSCWALVRLASFLVLYRALEFGTNEGATPISQLSYVRDAAFMLAAVNIIIGAYLAFAPGVAEAFGKQK
jgi:hypothetical protein